MLNLFFDLKILMISEFDVYNKFVEDVNNNPNFNFIVDKYAYGWKKSYVCNFVEVATGASGNQVYSYTDVSLSNAILLSNDCDMPLSFDVTKGLNPLNALYADNVQKVSTYTKNLGGCKRRDYCLYWSPSHFQNGLDIVPYPFVFNSGVYEVDDCTGGGGSGGGTECNIAFCFDQNVYGFCSIYAYCSDDPCTRTLYTSNSSSISTSAIEQILTQYPEAEQVFNSLIQSCEGDEYCPCNEIANVMPGCDGLFGNCLKQPGEENELFWNGGVWSAANKASSFYNSTESLSAIVFPNPFSHNLNIEIRSPVASQGAIAIINSLNETVWKQVVYLEQGVNKILWESKGNPSGMYYVVIRTEDGNWLSKKAVLLDR